MLKGGLKAPKGAHAEQACVLAEPFLHIHDVCSSEGIHGIGTSGVLPCTHLLKVHPSCAAAAMFSRVTSFQSYSGRYIPAHLFYITFQLTVALAAKAAAATAGSTSARTRRRECRQHSRAVWLRAWACPRNGQWPNSSRKIAAVQIASSTVARELAAWRPALAGGGPWPQVFWWKRYAAHCLATPMTLPDIPPRIVTHVPNRIRGAMSPTLSRFRIAFRLTPSTTRRRHQCRRCVCDFTAMCGTTLPVGVGVALIFGADRPRGPRTHLVCTAAN